MPEALITVLADALPRTGSVYALGFDGPTREALEALLAHADVQFVEDASSLTVPRDVVVAGPQWEGTFAGLPERSFTDRLARLDGALARGGTLALVMPNLHSSSHLLVAAPRQHRAFDLEGGGYDDSRPAAPKDLVRAFTAIGHTATNVYSVFGGAYRWATLGPEAFETARRCDAIPQAVERALAAALPEDAQRALPVELFVDSLTAAGALHTAAEYFVALSGGRARALHVGADVPGTSQWMDGSPQDAQWIVGGPSEDIDRPHRVPVGPTAESLLLQAIAAADTGKFRQVAERLSSWAMTSSALDHRDDLDWRDAVSDGATFQLALDFTGTKGHSSAPERPKLLARAWRHFAARVRYFEPDLPWPATLSDGELVRIWLSMSGIAEDQAAALAAETENLVEAVAEDDPWTRAYSIEEAAARIVALEEEVSALHATLKARDEELAVRARVIRSLRAQVLNASLYRDKMAKANEDIKNSAAFKLASQFRKAALITRPKLLVRTVGKAADQRLRAIRRVS